MTNKKKLILKIIRIILLNYVTEYEDFDLDNILIDEKSYENILVYNNSYKILIGAKPLY